MAVFVKRRALGHGPTEKPGTSGFNFRLLEETGIRAFSRLADTLFHRAWFDTTRQPSFDAIKRYLAELATRENVKKALTKPSRDESITTKFDPDLKSSGKAGVKAIHHHLSSELALIAL